MMISRKTKTDDATAQREEHTPEDRRHCKQCGAPLARDTRGEYCANCKSNKEETRNKILAVAAVAVTPVIGAVVKYGPKIGKAIFKSK